MITVSLHVSLIPKCPPQRSEVSATVLEGTVLAWLRNATKPNSSLQVAALKVAAGALRRAAITDLCDRTRQEFCRNFEPPLLAFGRVWNGSTHVGLTVWGNGEHQSVRRQLLGGSLAAGRPPAAGVGR
jgi:hypothetical protein